MNKFLAGGGTDPTHPNPPVGKTPYVIWGCILYSTYIGFKYMIILSLCFEIFLCITLTDLLLASILISCFSVFLAGVTVIV